MKPISEFEALIHRVANTMAEQEVFVSPADVGQIVSLFLEGIVHTGPASPSDGVLQAIADECAKVQDETIPPR